MGFHKPVCSRAAHEAAAISSGKHCPPPSSLTQPATHAFGVHQPRRSFSHTNTPPPHLAPGAPHLSGDRTPAPGQCWNHRQDGRGAGGLPCDLGLPVAEMCLKCHLAWEGSCPHIPSCCIVGGFWLIATQPFSDLCLFVCSLLLESGI